MTRNIHSESSDPQSCQIAVNRCLLYNADCFDIFPTIQNKSIDMILCDLPYGTTSCKWDSILPFDKLWYEYKRVIKDDGVIVLTASQPFTSALIMSNPQMFKYEIIWEKNKPSNIMQAKNSILKYHENVLIFSNQNICPTSKNQMRYYPQGLKKCNKKVKSVMKNEGIHGNRETKKYTLENTNYPKSILKFDKTSDAKHPSEKPVSLMGYLIQTFTKENELVLDNCMGSNSTGIACQKLNRKYIGIEKDKKFYKMAVERALNFENAPMLF